MKVLAKDKKTGKTLVEGTLWELLVSELFQLRDLCGQEIPQFEDISFTLDDVEVPQPDFDRLFEPLGSTDPPRRNVINFAIARMKLKSKEKKD